MNERLATALSAAVLTAAAMGALLGPSALASHAQPQTQTVVAAPQPTTSPDSVKDVATAACQAGASLLDPGLTSAGNILIQAIEHQPMDEQAAYGKQISLRMAIQCPQVSKALSDLAHGTPRAVEV